MWRTGNHTKIMDNTNILQEKKFKITYLASKLAKQYDSIKDACYDLKNKMIREMLETGELTLIGFHKVGEYKHFNGFGTKVKSFYANFYESRDKKYCFHRPRIDGRGKGFLGEVYNLAENKEIKKITKKEQAELLRDELFADIASELKKIKKEENARMKKTKKHIESLNGVYTHYIYGKYNDDSAKFKFEIVGKKEIKLTEMVKDYSWSKNYSYSFKSVNDIVYFK